MYNSSSIIKPRSGGGGGLTEDDVNTLIEQQIAEFADGTEASGRNGWIIAPSVEMSGVSTVDLTGAPSAANEVDIAIQGLSTTGTSSMYVRVFDATGTLLSTPYYGYLNNLAGTALSSVAESPGDAAIVAGGLLAPNFVSGSIRLRRHLGETWRIEAELFDASARRLVSSHVTSGVGAGITGIRLLLGSAGVSWDSGTAALKWRR